MMKIIILGGTGYLGTKLVKNLVKNNNLIVIHSKNSKNLDSIFFQKRIKLISYSYLKENDSVIEGTDIVYSLIGVYKKQDVTDQNIIDGNFCIPIDFFIRCLKFKVKKFISIDTGLPDTFNIYSYSKSIFRETAKWYIAQNDVMEFINIQPEIFYGEDEPRDRFIPSTIIKLKKGIDINMTLGYQKRDYIYINDLVNVLVNLPKIKFNRYINIPVGTGSSPSVREVVLYLKKITNSNSKINFGAVKLRCNEPNCKADISTLKKLNLKIRTPWKEGMKKLVKFIE